MRTYTIAHLSDLHVTSPRLRGRRLLSPKRLTAALAWKWRKRAHHSPEILDLVIRDLHELCPDAVVITGDLTQLGLPGEYREAREWLQKLDSVVGVSVVPGNHDVTAPESRSETLDLWAPWVAGPGDPAAGGSPASRAGAGFPTLRITGDLALIGVSSARPTPLLMATGRVGEEQLGRLRILLRESRDAGLCRVVFLHHPPCAGVVSWRKRLTDVRALGTVLEAGGVELLLHGHAHRPVFSSVSVRETRVPVIGAPSITQVTRGRPCYLVHRVARSENGWRIASFFRRHSPDGAGFEESPAPGLDRSLEDCALSGDEPDR